MSTTNPDSGRPPADTVGGLTSTPHGSPHADDHNISGPPDASTIARGHEVDRYDAVSVFSVPLLVVLFFVLAFGTVSVIFYFIAPSISDPSEHPQAIERNNKSLNERLDRIGRGKEVDQPRLEDLKQRTGNARAVTQPETQEGNSPWLHAEDLRPSKEHMPQLFETKWLDANKTVARISIADAMEMADKLFKVQTPASLLLNSMTVPTAANAGRGVPPKLSPPPAGGKN